MAYLKSKKTKNILYITIISILIIFFTFYTTDKDTQKEFPVGIWQGTFEEKPLTLEFKDNGCMVLISEGEDAIVFGSYSIDFEKQPGYLDLVFIDPPWQPFITIIEKVDDDMFRTQIIEGETTRPLDFTSEAILMHRVQDHVVPDFKTIEQRDEELKELLFKESIWFEGTNHQELLDICEALFRYQFTNNASGQQQNAPSYYLSIYDADPPEDLIARFQSNNIPVKPGSEFQMGSGLLFEIRSIKLINKKNAEIKGGYYEGLGSSSGNTYLLKKKWGTWKVVSDTMHWIS